MSKSKEEIDELVDQALKEDVEISMGSAKPLQDVPKAQLVVNKKLIEEIRSLDQTMTTYARWSRCLTIALVLLSVALLGVGLIDIIA